MPSNPPVTYGFPAPSQISLDATSTGASNAPWPSSPALANKVSVVRNPNPKSLNFRNDSNRPMKPDFAGDNKAQMETQPRARVAPTKVHSNKVMVKATSHQ